MNVDATIKSEYTNEEKSQCGSDIIYVAVAGNVNLAEQKEEKKKKEGKKDTVTYFYCSELATRGANA